MNITTRTILILTLSLAASGLVAQEEVQPADTPQPVATAQEEPIQDPAPVAASEELEAVTETETEAASEPISSYELRNQFGDVLLRHPYNLGTILAHDPTLINNEQFISEYPELERFIEEHPEIARNPTFYLANFTHRAQRGSVLENILEPIMIFAVFVLIAYALAWAIRTVIEQKRWRRLSQTQSEVHNKILDRFGTSEEVIAYLKSPAGAKFLEAAPIPLHAQPPSETSAPFTRVMLSIQLGVVLAIGSIGMLLVSFRLPEHSGDELFAFGMIAFFVGAGFIISAGVSLFMSQRLGLWDLPGSSRAADQSIDPGTVR